MRRQSSWIRYGLARLRPLGRPIFWAPSIALLFLVLFAWEFFSQAELASYFGISTPSETLTREDQAIGADIDSLPLLMNDIRITSKAETADSVTPLSPDLATPNRLFSSAPDPIAPLQPDQTPSSQGVFGVFKSALTTELGLTNVAQSTIADPAALPPNRLQEAIAKLASENRPFVAQTPIEGTIRLDPPSINAAPQSSLPNSFSSLVEGTQPIVPGTIPTVSAPLLDAERGASVAAPLNFPVIAPQPVETQPSSFGVIQNAPIFNQQPFSIPRSIPGRTIGGGNINTFSNP